MKDYKDIGEQFIRSIYEYCLLEKQLEKELALTNGWLKPHKLLELTGMSAAERAQKEIEFMKYQE